MIIDIRKAIKAGATGKQEKMVKVTEKKAGSRAPRVYYRRQKINVDESKGDKEEKKLDPLSIKQKESHADIADNINQIGSAVLAETADKIKEIKTPEIKKKTMEFSGIALNVGITSAINTALGHAGNYLAGMGLVIGGAVSYLKAKFGKKPKDIGDMKPSEASQLISQQQAQQEQVQKSFEGKVVESYEGIIEKALDDESEDMNLIEKLIELSDSFNDEVKKYVGKLSGGKSKVGKDEDEFQINKEDLDKAEKVLRDIPNKFRDALVKYKNKRIAIRNTTK